MNWLAHAVLSPPIREIRAANVLADILERGERSQMPLAFQAGFALHQAIDAATDSSPYFRRAAARLKSPYQRFAGVIVDLVNDHFLVESWVEHGLPDYATFHEELRSEIVQAIPDLPYRASGIAQRMIEDRWLESYATTSGLELTLQRVAMRVFSRTGRSFALDGAIAEMQADWDLYREDFAGLFAELRRKFRCELEPLRA